MASRSKRFYAFIINFSIFMILPYIFVLVVRAIDPAMAESDAFMSAIGFLLIAIVIIQFTMLSVSGQDIGKKILKIKIVKYSTGENGGFYPNVLLRVVLNGVFSIIPIYPFIDLLWIFKEHQRCLHDIIADTKVVNCINA